MKEPTSFLDALDLSFRFTNQNPQHLPQLIYHIDQNFYFIDEDYINHFERQATLVDYLVAEVEKGKLQALAFFSVSKTLLKWLRWTYKNKKEIEKDDPNIASFKQSRGAILEALCKLYNNYPEEVFAVMLDFSVGHKKDNKYTLAFDLVYLIPWIDSKMNNTDFRHCYYVREMVRSSIKGKFSHDDFKRLKSTFTHPTYSLFELVNWDQHRGKDDFDFENYREFEKLKKADITKKRTFKTKDEVKQFITQYREILEWSEVRIYSQHKVIDAIVKANLIINNEIGFVTFVEFARLQDIGRFNSDFFISYSSIDSLTVHSKLAERFWKAIDPEGLNEIWKLEVLTSLPVESITKEHISRLHIVLYDINRNFQIRLERLRKYEELDQKILPIVLQIIVKKIEEENLKICFDQEFFIHVSSLVENTDLLKKAYIQQDELNHHFDYNGKGLLAVLQKDNSFLLEYIKAIFKMDMQDRTKDQRGMAIFWELPNIEEILDEVIEYMSNIVKHYSLSEHFANSFFQQLTNRAERADKYLLRLIEKYSDQPKIIRIAFDIIHNSRKALFEEAFVTYIQKNQEIGCFREIKWTDNQILYSGNDIVGAIKAAKWEKLLNLVERAKLGTKTRSIRNYIKDRRDGELRHAEDEKRRKFFNSF